MLKRLLLAVILTIILTGLTSEAEEGVKTPVPSGYKEINLFGDSSEVMTKEGLVTIQGRPYRKLEYQSQVYYVRLLQDLSSSETELLCEDDLRKNPEPRLIEGSIQILKRTRLFVDGLRRSCSGNTGRRIITLSPDFRVGLSFADEKKDILKNKKVFLAPGSALGFSGEW